MSLKSFLLNTIAASELFTPQQRRSLYAWLGLPPVGLGAAWIESHCFFQQSDLSNVLLWDGVFLNHHCFLDNSDRITIGNNTRIGNHVRILTTTHAKGFPLTQRGAIHKPVQIGRDCWIGAGVTILPGVTIGDRVTMGAGAVVTRHLEADGIYGGVPARRLEAPRGNAGRNALQHLSVTLPPSAIDASYLPLRSRCDSPSTQA